MYTRYTMQCAAEERGTTSNLFRGVPSVFHYVRNHWQDNKTNNNFSKQRLQRFDFLFLTCFMLYKDVSKTRVRNMLTCFLFMSQILRNFHVSNFLYLFLPVHFVVNILSYLKYHQNHVYILDYLFQVVFILSVFS